MKTFHKITFVVFSLMLAGILTFNVVEYPQILKRKGILPSASLEELESDFSRSLIKGGMSQSEAMEQQSFLDLIMSLELIVVILALVTINNALSAGDYGFVQKALIILGFLIAGMVGTPQVMLAMLAI